MAGEPCRSDPSTDVELHVESPAGDVGAHLDHAFERLYMLVDGQLATPYEISAAAFRCRWTSQPDGKYTAMLSVQTLGEYDFS